MFSLLKLLKFIKNYRFQVTLSLLLLMISSGLNIIQPKLIEWAIDLGIQKQVLNNIILFSLGILFAALIGNGFNFFSAYILTKSGQGMAYELRNTLYKKVMSFSFANLDKWRTGELLVRMNADANTVRMFIQMGLLIIIQSVLILGGVLVIMFLTNIKLATIMAIIFPSILILFFIIASKIRPLFLIVREKLDKINNALQENLSGAKVVRAYNRQDHEIKRFNSLNKEFFKKSLKVGYIIAVLFPLLVFVGNLTMVITLWVGGVDVINNTLNPSQYGLTLGQLVAFSNYTMLIIFPIIMLGMVLNFLSMASASAQRIEELLKQEPIVKQDINAISLTKLKGKIEFKNVCFHYGEGENAVDDINLIIKPGEKVGMIGTTASGKSSLIHLILRFYDPQKGAIFIDDINIKKLSFSTLRTKIALVLQESLLFSGTIKENLVFAKPDATEEELKRAVLLSCAEDFIMVQDSGWDKHVGEGGTGLSGGQRQRVALARAIITNPDILILDDVTSSLDLETEKRIIANLYNELSNKTCIIISQKINTIMKADRIFIFENGSITEVGTHNELLVKSKIYADIAETQSSQVFS